jgi:multidrug efflux pump subunit AcrA (membrane-fusion protein)
MSHARRSVAWALLLALAACERRAPAPGAPSTPDPGMEPTPAAPAAEVPIAFDIAGTQVELKVGIGTRVRRGEIVAALDAARASAEVDTSRQELTRAEEELQAARTNYLAAIQRRETGAAPHEDVAPQQAALDAATRRRDAALRRVYSANENREKSFLRSPADGMIRSVLVASNQAVSAGQPILRIAPD